MPCNRGRADHRTMLSSRCWPLGALALVLAGAALAPASSAQSAQRFESPPVLNAAQVLPPSLQRGPNFTVGNRVENDGLLNHYDLQTGYGPFQVESTELLRVREEELAALREMEKLDIPSEFLKSAGSTATAPLRGAARLLTRPAETVRDTAQGVGRMFGRVGQALSPSADDNPDGAFAGITGFSAAKRKIAVSYGVDPYSRFPPLQERLIALARASAAGSLAVRGALMIVPGAAGIGIGVSSGIENAGQLLRDKTPAELNEINRASLRSLGVGEPTIDAFLATPVLTPADKTIIVESLRQLTSAHAQGVYIASAAKAPDPASAYFVRRRAEMMAVYNRKVEPVTGFLDLGGVPMMRTRSGKVMALMPFDYVAWTRHTAEIFEGITRAAPRGAPRPALGLWVTGKVSALSGSALKRLGWQVRQDVHF